jgi:hypothetical protein
MPRLLRIITGDAKAFVNGPANQRVLQLHRVRGPAAERQVPAVPGRHRRGAHLPLPELLGRRRHRRRQPPHPCGLRRRRRLLPGRLARRPQLVQRIVYDVDAPSLADGGRTTPLLAVDSFPEQLHKPVTDHGDFVNVFGDGLMRS